VHPIALQLAEPVFDPSFFSLQFCGEQMAELRVQLTELIDRHRLEIGRFHHLPRGMRPNVTDQKN
jgi:hypothetical protein